MDPYDVPDFKWIDPATKRISPAESLKPPYLMLPEGKARLFVPKGPGKVPIRCTMEP